jgi:Uma2 family endonuclease
MLEYRFPGYLPSAEDLLDSDETPVDEDWSWRFPPAKEVRNELQELIPALLKSILLMLWAERMDWLFAIDIGIYTDPDQLPIVPDAFLSLGVERCYDEELRSGQSATDAEFQRRLDLVEAILVNKFPQLSFEEVLQVMRYWTLMGWRI